jgi:hypothetical protein
LRRDIDYDIAIPRAKRVPDIPTPTRPPIVRHRVAKVLRDQLGDFVREALAFVIRRRHVVRVCAYAQNALLVPNERAGGER